MLFLKQSIKYVVLCYIKYIRIKNSGTLYKLIKQKSLSSRLKYQSYVINLTYLIYKNMLQIFRKSN